MNGFLPIKPFQETLNGSYCGPATIKMVLDYFGISRTEEEIAVLANRDPNLGISDSDIKRVLESFNLKVTIKNFADFTDIQAALNQDHPVIVNWFTRGRYDYDEDTVADGHYSVVIGMDKTHIYLQDPEVGRVRKILKDDFARVWFDFTSDRIEKWEDLIIRQAITVSRK